MYSEALLLVHTHLESCVSLILLSFKNNLYIADARPLLDFANFFCKYFTDIFFQSETCLFILLTVSFTDQKFLLLMKFALFDFFFHGWCF